MIVAIIAAAVERERGEAVGPRLPLDRGSRATVSASEPYMSACPRSMSVTAAGASSTAAAWLMASSRRHMLYAVPARAMCAWRWWAGAPLDSAARWDLLGQLQRGLEPAGAEGRGPHAEHDRDPCFGRTEPFGQQPGPVDAGERLAAGEPAGHLDGSEQHEFEIELSLDDRRRNLQAMDLLDPVGEVGSGFVPGLAGGGGRSCECPGIGGRFGPPGEAEVLGGELGHVTGTDEVGDTAVQLTAVT